MRTRLFMAAVLVPMLMVAQGCASKPKSFVESSPGWKSIELRPGLQSNYAEAWQTTVDVIARNADIEVMDRDSGYIKTGWKIWSSEAQGMRGVVDTYAGRVIVKFPDVARPERVDLKTEAQWTRGGVIRSGFDSDYQRDIYEELAGRLGRTVPD